MSLQQDLKNEVAEIFQKNWTTRDGTVVPAPKDVGMKNDAVKLEGAVLYADLKGSTKMVDAKTRQFSAEIYKSFLLCAAKIIKNEGGEITAYDGDRVMAVFLGDLKRSNAARCALKINWAVKHVVNPGITAQYGSSSYEVKQVVGVDVSDLFVARTGVRGDNDLVWVGPAANYAAKLCNLDEEGFHSYITARVFEKMSDDSKKGGQTQDMWERRTWKAMNDMIIYRSSWTWNV